MAIDPVLTGPGTKMAKTSKTEERGTNPVKRKGYQPLIRNDEGAHTGGSCQSCGTPLQFWFEYRLCDRCVVIPDRAVIRT